MDHNHGQGSSDPEEQLKLLIEQINQSSLSDGMRTDELYRLRDFFKKGGKADQVEDLLKSYDRAKWLLKLMGMFLLAAPAVAAVIQGFYKVVAWIKQ